MEQHVLDKWPNTNYAMNAQIGIAKNHFAKDEMENAASAIDNLVAGYSDMEQLPREILMLGEGYYKKGLEIYKGDLPPEATKSPAQQANKQKLQKNFEKSLGIWLRTIAAIEANDFTADYAMTAEYYHYAGTCYKLMGQYEKAIDYYKKVVENWPEYEAGGGL